MAKMPIPNLIGLNVRTYLVCWYDSDDWEGILAGFLTTIAVPEFWDADTGDIDQVLEASGLIVDSNIDVAERDVDMGCLSILTGSKLSETVPQTASGPGFFDELEVPAGEVWDVYGVSMVGFGGTATAFQLYAVGGFPRFPRFFNEEGPADSVLTSTTRVRMTAGDIIRMQITGGSMEYGYTVWGWRYTL